MNCPTIDKNRLSFVRAKKENINIMLDIIRRCVSEINAADYTQNQVKDLLNGFTADWLEFLEKDEWCLDSNLIEIPSSKSSHGFYFKCGYRYQEYPPVFKNGTTIMYKQNK